MSQTQPSLSSENKVSNQPNEELRTDLSHKTKGPPSQRSNHQTHAFFILIISIELYSPLEMSDSVKLPPNPLYRNIFLRTISHASSLGADLGECFRALQDAGALSSQSWMSAWSELGSRLNRHAASLLEAKPSQRLSAKLAFLRASNYHRTAFAHMWGHPMSEHAVMPSYNAMRANFASAAKLFDPPFLPLEIPYQDVKMRGYLMNPLDASRNGRLMVVIGGYDSPMEELYFFCGHHALSRGYSVLIFDGPGQGGSLIEAGMNLSHNYDKVLANVLRAASEHGSWRQTVVMGLSLGGLLCLQAVSSEKNASRIHALVADPAELNLIDAFRSRLPFPQSICDQLPEGPPWAAWLLDLFLRQKAGGNNMIGWALRRGMLVHGCSTPIEWVKSLHEFDNESILGGIKMPVLITRAEKDEIGNQAANVYERLVNCEKKTFMVFEDEDGAAEHCQTGARMFYSERVFAWLDETLS
jgi:pimeloyl-ACP methyl ester carboxylesterase